ncbi:MAG: FRG domain-containing protein [Spirochaetes bacterium]|nr:FRG domain-containing protein [Spirochaetota bacterium]
MEYEKFITIECKTVQEFWDRLSPEKPLKKDPSKFIYRGHADSSWDLLPKVLRKKNEYSKIIYNKDSLTAEYQVLLELIILNNFVNGCDLIGLQIPNDSPKFREEHLDTNKNDLYFKNPKEWPNKELYELMSLAQHHGTPTRLLDWTKRSYIAAYFACAEAISLINRKDFDINKKEIAVWALDIELRYLYYTYKDKTHIYKFDILKVPGSNNKNLSAQNGLFTLQRYEEVERGKNFEYYGLEEIFKSLPDSPLSKITLPAKYSKDVLYKCDLYGINAATLFPNYNGVSKYVSDKINSEKFKYLNDNAVK